MTPHPLDPCDAQELNSSLASSQPRPLHPPRLGTVRFCGLLSYEKGLDLQRTYQAERAADRCPDQLLLMEHEPLYTAGRTTRDSHLASEAHLGEQTGIPLIRTDRGGSITYHGPGQIVGYPILRLADHCAGPKSYVRLLEDVLITTLAEWDIVAHRRDRFPGVWVGGEHPSKIAFIGVRISQGVTTHGFALNVSPDLAPFSHIIPCGIVGCDITSMADRLGTAPDIYAVQQRLADVFAERFHLTWTVAPAQEKPAHHESLGEHPSIA
jgi:lipoyl(octanoyl) transferase